MNEGALGVKEWNNHTYLHPVGLLATVLLGVLILIIPRRYAIVPMVVLACLIPSAQRLVIAGADFTLLRILVVFAWSRLFMRKEFHGFVWNRLDTMLVCWMAGGSIVYMLGNGTTESFVNRAGWMFDGFGMYFFFRCVLREWTDLDFLIHTFIVVGFVVAIAFTFERATGKNLFSAFGGVPSDTVVRNGRLRCQGAFSHAILAGCFWVVAMPWILALVVRGHRLLAWAGFSACTLIMMNSASSTPLLAFCIMLLGWALYPAREYLYLFRWGGLALLMFLHLIMDKPVWHLIARVNAVGGSTGYHRFKIMDATIHNFSKWCLLGERNPMSWGVWEMRDITNQYILEALQGGLLALVLFVGMIAVAFRTLGRTLRVCRDRPADYIMVWGIGTALFVHVCIFFSVSYFGQIIMLWYLTLAMIGSLPGIASQQIQAIPSTSSSQEFIGLAHLRERR